MHPFTKQDGMYLCPKSRSDLSVPEKKSRHTEMNNISVPLPSRNNLGSRINLNNAKAKLQKRLQSAQESLAFYYKMGFGPSYILPLNNTIYHTKEMMKEVNRRIKMRHENLSKRHFSRANLNKVLNARQRYRNPSTFHLYIQALENLMKKYRIPRSNRNKGGPWNLVNKMISENKLSRNQLAHAYGLHWQIQAAKKRRART
jgi:hypothetical protein